MILSDLICIYYIWLHLGISDSDGDAVKEVWRTHVVYLKAECIVNLMTYNSN